VVVGRKGLDVARRHYSGMPHRRAVIHVAKAGNALQGVRESKRDDVESRTRARQGCNFGFNRRGARDDCRNIPAPPAIAMNTPFHLLRLEPAPTQRDSESVHLARLSDPQWGAPLFLAPALPTPRQFSSELPFTVNFPPRLRRQP